MADHRAEQILAAVTTLLTGLTTTATRVSRDQVDPVAAVPALSIEMGGDEVLEGSDNNMAFIDSLLNLQVVAYVKNATGLSTELNQIRKEVHAALYTDRTLALGFVISTYYTGTGAVEKTGGLENEAARQTINYSIHYRHSVADASA